MQVHQAESITTPSMLLVKDGFLSNVCDTADIVTYDEQVAKLNELKTAAMLLKAAEEKLLLTKDYQQRLAQSIATGVEEFARLAQ